MRNGVAHRRTPPSPKERTATGRTRQRFQFFVPGPAGFEAGAKFLLARGYQ
jgi:hypothetical protein